VYRSLGYQVLIAALLGIFTGLFLGPLAKVVKPIGDLFVMLLQMLVLPYICFSIIHGLGSITPQIARMLFKKAWPFWLFLWMLVFFVIVLFYQLIPAPLFGSFIPIRDTFSTVSLTQNILSYIIPENPFYDLVNNVVPAIAVLGVIIGFALMHLEKKDPLLGFLDRSIQVIEKILQWIALASPIGVFAHLAVVTGTVNFEDLYKLEFYVVCFIIASLFLTLIFLPQFLSCFTPIGLRESYRLLRTACLLSFITGLPTIAIPFLSSALSKIELKHHLPVQNVRIASQTVMPLAYAFVQIGNAFLLFFILFLSFYYRHPFTELEKTILSFLTIPLSIGSSATSINAISFLITRLGMPNHAIELFTQTMVVTLNFQVLLSVASVFVFSVIVLFSFYNLLKINWKGLLIRCGGSMTILVILIIAFKPFIHLDDHYRDLYLGRTMNDVIEEPVQVSINPSSAALSLRDPALLQLDPLHRILKTGILRVGYHPEVIPFSYFNEHGDLVGFDIAMAYQLARDLDCKLEFIPIDINHLTEELNAGVYDLAMSAILMDEQRIQNIEFSNYYLEQENVLIVPVKYKSQFTNLKTVIQRKDLKLGSTGAYSVVLDRHFPSVERVDGTLRDLAAGKADAWVWSYLPAFIWCLNHPDFTVVDYNGLLGKFYFGYPCKMGAIDFHVFLDSWISLKGQSGFTQSQHDYWIVGEPTKSKERWSVIRNIFHWIH
jgi:Na+/H+-dicarboxylate symporter/ABC-type amino acid transport substrate-binding protein